MMPLPTGSLVAALLFASACGSSSWYELAPDPDESYLPFGDANVATRTLAHPGGSTVDLYTPSDRRAPLVVFLPGAGVIGARYGWLGRVLASHGIAVAIAQPIGAFATSADTEGALAALARIDRDELDSPLRGRIDLTRIVLAGHSAGAVTQAGLTFVPHCPMGFCVAGAARPPGLRGLLLLSFHNQGDPATADRPMPAAEVPWLLVGGTRDGLTTPDESRATLERLQDRPVQLLEVIGMNHYQVTGWVDPQRDVALASDLWPEISGRDARALTATYAVRFARRTLLGDAGIDADLGAAQDSRVRSELRAARLMTAPDSPWPRVLSSPHGEPGLGDPDNSEIVATAGLGDAFYLLTRNDVSGAQLHRLRSDHTLERLPLPPNRHLNTLLGGLAAFQGQLFIGLSSGVQGNRRGSTGAELWRFDGAAFHPVISASTDADPEVTVAAVTGCGETTARIATGSSFAPGALRGATVDDLTGTAEPLVLEVVDNDASGLTVRSGESATSDEPVACDRLVTGTRLRIRQGADESGFGQPWNKAITALEASSDRLYVAAGLNLRDGAEVWSTSDGARFEIAVPRSFFGTHPDGQPLTSSVTAMHADGAVLYLGANGTNNAGARVVVLESGVPRMLAAPGVASYQIGSLASFNARLWATGFSFSGFSLASSEAGSPWHLEIGPNAASPAGFGDPAQITARLFPVGDELWLASVANVMTRAELRDQSAAAWRTRNGAAWQLVTAHAFGVNAVTVSRVFSWRGRTYAAAGGGSLTSRASFRPVQLYRLTEETLK